MGWALAKLGRLVAGGITLIKELTNGSLLAHEKRVLWWHATELCP